MPCASGGDDGHSLAERPARVRPRFYPTGSTGAEEGRVLIEPEAGDSSEQQFAASLDAPSRGSRRRFVPGALGSRAPLASPEDGGVAAEAGDEPAPAAVEEKNLGESVGAAESNPETEPAPSPGFAADDFAGAALAIDGGRTDDGDDGAQQWRQEVAARLHHYHSRRTRKPPRYPSLALKFDPPAYSAPAAPADAAPARSEAATAPAISEEVEEARVPATDVTNIIEFPHPLVPPPPRPDELAEPILDVPRILDAPEAVPKQVPLGGIILQPEETAAPSDLELPLQVAPLGRRLTAAALDAALVAAATLMFALIADKIAVLLPSARVLLGLGVALPAVLWAVFQYVFLVYTGSTPGMRLAGLHLSDFDGSVPDRVTRRWRALAMALSAVSLGLGFLWCLLDEDTLCWHDRITRTYLDAGPASGREMRQGPFFPQRVCAALRSVEAFLQRRDQETSQEPPAPPQG